MFAIATDPERAPEWIPGVTRLEPLSDGPVRAGWRFRETRTVGGRQVAAEVEVTQHEGPGDGEPPYRHAARSELMGVQGTYAFTFSPADDGAATDVQVHVELRAKGLLAKPVVAMLAKALRGREGELLEALARLCAREL